MIIEFINMQNKEYLLSELKSFEKEHSELDEFIDENPNSTDEISLQRFKKRRLVVKDKIKYIKSLIYPDIYA